eukprot:9470091-Pyramimonas_sp.AAC.1
MGKRRQIALRALRVELGRQGLGGVFRPSWAPQGHLDPLRGPGKHAPSERAGVYFCHRGPGAL